MAKKVKFEDVEDRYFVIQTGTDYYSDIPKKTCGSGIWLYTTKM